MDNFMDKLTGQFDAGELIRANGEAEEKELNRVREQAVENEKLLQEIRRLNLKNAELAEQAGQLIRCGIEQFEEYDRAADKAQQSHIEYAEQLKELKHELENGEEEQKAVLAALGSAIAAIDEKISKESEGSPAGLLEAIKALEEHVHKENVKVYRNVQAVVMDQSTQRAREMGDRLDALERNARKNSILMPLMAITLLAAAASLFIQLAGLLHLF